MRAALLAVLAVALAGCFQMSSVLTVRPDGSATLREELTLSGMGLMALASEGEDGADPWADLDVEGRAATMGEGVRLASFEPTEEGYVAVYAIDDVDGFAYAMQEGIGAADVGGDLTFRTAFTPATADAPATLRLLLPKPEPDKPDPAADGPDGEEQTGDAEIEQALGMMRMFLGDARVTIAVEVEGEITETTADYVEGPRVTLMDLPFDVFVDALADDPTLLEGGQPTADEVVDRVRGIEGIRIEEPGVVRVRFR